MTSRKPAEEFDLDAILLREVAARRSSTGSVLLDSSSPGGADADDLAVSDAVAVSEEASTPAPAVRSRRRTVVLSRYEQLFLRENIVRQRSPIYVSADTKVKLTEVVRRLGLSRISVTSFAENILSHHLELFRGEINRLHRQRNTKDIL